MGVLNDLKSIFKGKLAFKLARAFLLVGVLPLLAATIISSMTASGGLKEQSFRQLEMARDIKKVEVEKLFKNYSSDVKLVSSLENVKSFFVEFENIVASEGIDNDYYDAARKDYSPVLKNYTKGYKDLYFITTKGVVVFTFSDSGELGTSLTNGPYQDSGIARAFEKAVKGDVSIEDISSYKPLKGEPAGFIAGPIKKENGDIMGVLALRFSIDDINSIMTERAGMGTTGEIYLVGPDKLMRSDAFRDQTNHSVKASFADSAKGGVDTDAVREALAGNTGNEVIKNYLGKSVLSSYTPVNLGDTSWALIAEIDKSEAFAPVRNMQGLMVMIILIGIVAVLIVTALMVKPITEPVREMASYINNVAEGDLSDEFEFGSNDEIGDMGKALGRMSKYLKEMAETATDIASKDLSAEIEVKSEKDVLGNAFKNMVKGLRDAMAEIRTGSSQITIAISEISDNADEAARNNETAATAVEETTATMHEMAANIQNVARSSQSQASSVSETSAAIQQMVMSIQRVAESAQLLANLSKTTMKAVEDGFEAVTKSTNGTIEINESIMRSADTIAALCARAEDIGKIVDVIDDIAEQTNLLALNAAIEAARAGEQGLGFAVVAEEVRQLAERSAKSTKEISDLITGIQREAQDAVKTMEKSTQLVEKGVELSSQVTNALKSIGTNVEEFDRYASDISRATEEQARGSGQIAETTENLSGVTHEISSASDEQSAAADQIVSTMEKMREMIHQNASGASELASSAEEMKVQVEKFQDIVKMFQIEGLDPSRAIANEGKERRSIEEIGHGEGR
ncbi:MAG: HAMP domain-containing protein [Nitrospirota bacterium]|nr:MAG: HAMP domain-containing protein [Nitrospirota bacterium]